MTADVEDEELDLSGVNTENEFAVHWGENMPNHTKTMQGLGRYVNIGHTAMPQFRTRQEVFRFTAWILAMAESADLPDEEEQPYSFEDVLAAVQEV